MLQALDGTVWHRRGPRISEAYQPTTVPVTSCDRLSHSDQYFMAMSPHIQYLPLVGTVYWLRSNFRFFEPLRYGATCVAVQLEMESGNPLAGQQGPADHGERGRPAG